MVFKQRHCRWPHLLIALPILFWTDCGGGGQVVTPRPPEIQITLSPPTANVLTGATAQFTATISGTSNVAVTWAVGGVPGGNSVVGTINAQGLYTAPAWVPEPAGVGVRATSAADSSKSATASLTISSPQEDWPKYRRDLANTGRSGETGLSTANVHRLERKWMFDAGARVTASPAVATIAGLRTVYIGASNGIFYALDAETGQERWRFAVDRTGTTRCTPTSTCRIASSAAVANGVVYFGAENAFLYALNAATGALVWKTELGDTDQGYEIWSSPVIADGRVFIGVASHQADPCVVGRVDALDAATGTTAWSFDTIDQSTCPSGFCLGAGVWSSAAIDEEFQTLFIGTGNSGRGCANPTTSNATLYPDGILALDPTNGQLKGFFQTTPNDLNDIGDVGASPVLHSTETVDECAATQVITPWVTVPTKDSRVWTGLRGSGGFLSDPLAIDLASHDAIASPAVRPFTTTNPCGSGGLEVRQTGNDIFVPTFDGKLFNVRQTPDGATNIDWTLVLSTCPADNPCPLFSAPATIADLVFFGGGDGNFYASTVQGENVFSFGTLGLVASGPAISHSQVFFGSADHFVYCLSLDGQ